MPTCASRRFVTCSVRPLILRVTVLWETHRPLRPTASLTWLDTRVLAESKKPENIGPGPNSEPKGGRVERPNELPNGEREKGLGKGSEKNGSSSSKKLRWRLWMSPKRELKRTKGSVKWNALPPKPELKNGSLNGSLGNFCEWAREDSAPGSGPFVGGGQTPYLLYSCVGVISMACIARPFFTHLPVFLVVEDLVSVVHLYTTSTSTLVWFILS